MAQSPWSTPKSNQKYELSNEDRNQLEKVGSKLRPIVRVGSKSGVNAFIIGKTNSELGRHQIIKIEFVKTSGNAVRENVALLAKETNSECISIHGNIVILFRKHPNMTVESITKKYLV